MLIIFYSIFCLLFSWLEIPFANAISLLQPTLPSLHIFLFVYTIFFMFLLVSHLFTGNLLFKLSKLLLCCENVGCRLQSTSNLLLRLLLRTHTSANICFIRLSVFGISFCFCISGFAAWQWICADLYLALNSFSLQFCESLLRLFMQAAHSSLHRCLPTKQLLQYENEWIARSEWMKYFTI